MPKKEFNLSEKICWAYNDRKIYFEIKDIKEFIKRLKEELCKEMMERGIVNGLDHIPQPFIIMQIDKLAGDKLT